MLIFGGLLVLAAMLRASFNPSAAAVSLPLPTYAIDTTSGGVVKHYTGVLGAPLPIDVDGDLLPDVDVLVSGVNLSQLLQGVQPTISITRDPAALLLGMASPPLKIVLTFSLADPSGTITSRIGFGYDTGAGGAIPQHFNTTLGGLASAFNPLTATVDTIGGISGLNLGPAQPTYVGPLTLLLSLNPVGGASTAMSFAYQPFPGRSVIGYSTDSSGMHIQYNQTPGVATQLRTHVLVTNPDSSSLDVNGYVDPLPTAFHTDIATTPNTGSVDLTQTPAQRNPDASFKLVSTPASGAPAVVIGDLASIPGTVHAQWSTVPGQLAGSFDASDGGLGAVDLSYHNFSGAPLALHPFLPSQQQYVNFQSVPGGPFGTETEISAALQNVHHLDFAVTPTGISTHDSIGNGTRPLQVHYVSDTRSGTSGSLLSTDATVDPLPSQITLALDTPGAAQPVHVTSTNNATGNVTVTGHVRLTPAGATVACGAAQNLCADLKLEHLPNQLSVAEGNLDSFGQGVDVDDTPAVGQPGPNLTADVNLGPGVLSIPVNATAPIVGHFKAVGIPLHLRARLHTDSSSGQLDMAEFHGCDWNFSASPPACATPMQAGAIGSLTFDVHNFADGARPASIAPPVFSTPQYLSVVARQPSAAAPLVFEASGVLHSVREVDLRDVAGLVGVNTGIGDGSDLGANIDVDVPSLRLLGSTTFSPLPTQASFCFRQAGTPASTSAGVAYTADCENANPFGETPTPASTPTSVAFSANADFALGADVRYTDKASQHTDVIHVDTLRVPHSLIAHVRTPDPACSSSCLPMRAVYTLPPNSPPVTVNVSAKDLLGNSTCADPRPGAAATCISGTLENLPTSAALCYDPHNSGVCDSADATHNFALSTGTATGATPPPFNITNLALSLVSPPVAPATTPTLLRATGQILGIPPTIVGSLGGSGFALQTRGAAISHVDATLDNFLGPIGPVTPVVPPAPSLGSPGWPAPQSTVAALLRGSNLEIRAHVDNVTNVSYRPATDAGGTQLQDRILNAGFAAGDTVRTYADVITPAGDQIVVDALLENNPGNLQLCFRGPDPSAATAVQPVWCDNQAPDPTHAGAFQFRQTGSAPGGPPLNVYAYIRDRSASSSSVFAGTVQAADVPPILQATFASTGVQKYEVSGLQADGVTPRRIGNLDVDVANFDLQQSLSPYAAGHGPALLYPAGNGDSAFPPVTLAGQHLAAVAKDGAFQLRAGIGAATGTPGTHLQHLLFSSQPCSKPDANRDDYPFYPSRDDIGYTCIRSDFAKDAGAGATPLALAANLIANGQRIQLSGAGVTDVPAWLQATIASSGQLKSDTTFRRRCGAVGGSHPDSDNSCMPPLIRYDEAQQASPPILFGTVRIARQSSFASETTQLFNTGPDIALTDAHGNPIDFNADPAAGWGGDTGARLKVGSFEDTSTSAIDAGLRMSVPGSLTVDQIQQYTDSSSANPYSINDLSAHFVARDYPASAPHGQIVSGLGNLEAMVAQFNGACTAASDCRQILAQNDPSTSIPGEVGLDVFERGAKLSGGPADTDTLFQIDARLSSTLSLVAHIANLSNDPASSSVLGTTLNATLAHIPAVDESTPDYVCNATGPVTQSDASSPGCRPGARLVFDLVNGDSIHNLVTGHFQTCDEGGSCSEGGTSDSHIDHVNINLDMQPPGSLTRRLEIVVHPDSTNSTAGVQVDGFASVDTTDSTSAKFSGSGDVNLDKLQIIDQKSSSPYPVLGFLHATAEFWLFATLDLQFQIGQGTNGVTEFVLRQDGFHFDVTSTGGSTVVGPINLVAGGPGAVNVTDDCNDDSGTYGIYLNVYGPLGLCIAFYYPESFATFPFSEGIYQCNYHFNSDGYYEDTSVGSNLNEGNNTVTVSDGELDFAVNPFADSHIGYYLSGIAPSHDDFLKTLTESLCSADGANSVYSPEGPVNNLGDTGYPSDPVNYPNHPVPGASLNLAEVGGTDGPATPLIPPGPTPPAPPSGPTPDGIAPTSQLITIPTTPDGATVAGHAYYLSDPFGVIMATDDPGGSAVAAVRYSINGGPYQPYFGPFAIPAGTSTVCTFARDAAGNAESPHCDQFYVDDAAPTVAVNAPPVDGANGWYVSTPTVTVAAADPTNSNGTAGSGVASVTTSLDGAAPVTTSGTQSLTIPAGIHELRAYATDAAGNRSLIADQVFQVQTAHPVTVARLWPPAPAQNGWWRTTPTLYLTASDGDQTAGVASVQYSVDGGAFQTYSGPLTVPENVHTIRFRALDNSGAANSEPLQTTTVPVDVTPPLAAATSPSPVVFIPLLGSARLGWQVSDNLSTSVHVYVLVHNALGQTVRVLDGGNVAITPGVVTSGSTSWDGRSVGLTSILPVGVYYYTVVVQDQAGNVAQSGNSRPLQIAAL